MIRDQFITAALSPSNQADLESAEIEFRLVRLQEEPYKFGIVSFDVCRAEDELFHFGPRHRTIGYAPLWHFLPGGKGVGYGVFLAGIGRSKDREFDAASAEQMFHELTKRLEKLIFQHWMILRELLQHLKKSKVELKLNFLKDGIDLREIMQLKSPFDTGQVMPKFFEILRAPPRTRFREQLVSYAVISHFHKRRRPLPSISGDCPFSSLEKRIQARWMYANGWDQSLIPRPIGRWKLVAKIELTKELLKVNPESLSSDESHVRRAKMLLYTFWTPFRRGKLSPTEVELMKPEYRDFAYTPQWVSKRNLAKVRKFEGQWLEDVGIPALQTIFRWETGHQFSSDSVRRLCSDLRLRSLVKRGRKPGKRKREPAGDSASQIRRSR